MSERLPIEQNLKSRSSNLPILIEGGVLVGSSSYSSRILGASLLGVALIILCIWVIRRRIKKYLETTVGLPTVFWRPKFFNYLPKEEINAINVHGISSEDARKMNSSSITNVLPRMERLNGPYGMYATVYGLWTKVIHVAHPVPAKAILQSSNLKAPGYDHFKNFCGEGVFTADGQDWKRKRSSVVHALFKPPKKQIDSNGKEAAPHAFGDRLEMEANKAASEFLDAFLNTSTGAQPKNVVPLLQNATVRIIYRYLTHDDSLDGVIADSDLTKASNQGCYRQRAASWLLAAYLQSIVSIRMIILAQ